MGDAIGQTLSLAVVQPSARSRSSLAGLNPKNLLVGDRRRSDDRADRDPGRGTGRRLRRVRARRQRVGVAMPVVIFFTLGDRAGPVLGRMKGWLGQHNAAIMADALSRDRREAPGRRDLRLLRLAAASPEASRLHLAAGLRPGVAPRRANRSTSAFPGPSGTSSTTRDGSTTTPSSPASRAMARAGSRPTRTCATRSP